MNENLEWNFYYWGPYLWKTKIEQKFCDELFERAKKSNIKHNKYLAAHIENEILYLKEDMKWFVNEITPYTNLYFQTGNFWYKEVKETKLESLWINYMKNGEFNPEHTHDGDISFVIYLKIPELLKKECEQNNANSPGPGSITFSFGERMNYFTTAHNFFPEEGDLFMFPATLRHIVFPFKSDCVRISVSGNFYIK